MGDRIPTKGEMVLYHDPDTARVYPAVVVHAYEGHPGALALHVFTLEGAETVRHVRGAPGEFGHWSTRPES